MNFPSLFKKLERSLFGDFGEVYYFIVFITKANIPFPFEFTLQRTHSKNASSL